MIKNSILFISCILVYVFIPLLGFSQEVYYTLDSSQTRSFVFSQLVNDALQFASIDDKKKIEPVLYTQDNKQQYFIFYTSQLSQIEQKKSLAEQVENRINEFEFGREDNKNIKYPYKITIIPAQEVENTQNIEQGYSSWDILLDRSKSLERLVYYFQDRKGYHINFSVIGNSTNISVYIENIEYISNVSIPYPLAQLINMTLDDITSITHKYVQWHNILPQRKNFKSYELSRQFAVYLENNRKKNQDIPLGEQERLFLDLQNILAYIGSSKNINENQFFPIYGNKQRVPTTDINYLQRYTNNIFKFLQTYPEFDVQFTNEIFLKALREQKFNQIFFRLYLSSLKYPRTWYLVLSGVEAQFNENREERYTKVYATVPFFTPSGKFNVFFPSEIEDELSQNVSKVDSTFSNQKVSEIVANVLFLFKVHSFSVPLSNIGAREDTSQGTRFGIIPNSEPLPDPKTRFEP